MKASGWFVATILAAQALWGQVEPNAGSWQTWVLSSGDQFRLSDPAQFGAGKSELAWLKNFMAQADANALGQVAHWDAGPPSYRWIQLTLQEANNRNLAAPFSTRAMALVGVAINDATVAAWDTKYTYDRQRPSLVDSSIVPRVAVPLSPSFPSEHAVTAGAASVVLGYLFPDKADAFASLAEEAARSRLFPGVQYPSDMLAGLQLGRAVGAAVVAYAKGDNADEVFTGVYVAAPGVWGAANPVAPLAGTWRPWVIGSGSSVRPGPPPAAGSPEAVAQFLGVKNQVRTNATNHSAWFWQPSFITPWLDTVHREVFEHRWDINPPRAARAYALSTIAQHDATIACWDTKYAYLEPRPSMADPEIVPLFANPGHPGFPSGHACASASIATVLGFLFPPEADALAAQASDAGLSTFYAGIHTRNDVDAGMAIGQRVGQKIIQQASANRTE